MPPTSFVQITKCSVFTSQAADIIDEIFREKLRGEKQRFASSTARSDTSSDDDDERLNDYVQNHRVSLPLIDIDDISADSDEIEEEFQSIYTATQTAQDDTDLSDNWMFKRRGEDGTSSVVSATSPVGMLVPSPTEDIRARIGNRNADEIESDLSETGSDLDDSLDADVANEKDRLNVTIDVPHVLVQSKTLIGGKNEMASFEHSKLIDLLEPGSLVSEQSLTGQSPVISEAKNELILIDATNDKVNANKTQRTEAVNDLLDLGPVPMPR